MNIQGRARRGSNRGRRLAAELANELASTSNILRVTRLVLARSKASNARNAFD